jgi:iron complex transport system ATP-binding protein
MNSEREFSAIEGRNVSYSYGDQQAVRDVSLTIRSGEFVAIIGPNGSGKTTLLSCLSGHLHPTSGRSYLHGRELSEIRARDIARVLALVPQEFQVPFAYRVREIVSFGRTSYLGYLGALSDADHAAIDMALAQTGTAEMQGRLFNELSGGERQRVIIALALAQNPRILLLDEPTAQLDLSHQIEVLRLIKNFNHERGLTVLASLHDIDLAAALFPRIVALCDGRIVADGSPEDVITPSIIHSVFGVPARVLRDNSMGPPRVLPVI